jgi:DNA-binding CsgD family transcriptional regulator
MASELNNGIAGNNHLIIGTIGNGLFILDDHGNLQAHLDSRNFLQNNTILSVAFDAAGNIWAGLDRGIDLISLHSGMDFYVDPSGTMGSVYAAVLDGMDLLVGTNQGLYRYSFLAGEGFVKPVAVSGLAGQVWDLKNIDGEILCGHTGGTYRIEGDRAVRISDVHGGFEIRRMQGRSSEHLLQSTYSTFAVYSVFDRRWQLDHPVQGFNEPAISFETDHLGNIWCAHAIRGIFRIRLKPDLRSVESTVTYASDKGLPGDRQVYVSKVENRIVFPSDSGLFTWDDLNDTIIPFGQLAGKLGDFSNARQIMPSGEHNYWFIKGHDVALFRIAGPNADQLYRYDFSMQGLYLNSRFPKIIMLKEGLHLICLDNGFALFDETGMRTIEQPTPVQIRSARFDARGDGERLLPIVEADKPLRIPYNFRSLTIGFSAGTGYRHPLYCQRLIGLDKDWGPWSDQPSSAFTRLPPGDYTLEVISMNINGLPGQPARYPFSVSPPWYRSIAALILYGCILLAFILFFRVLFLKRLRLHKALLEEAEAENHRQAMLRAEQELIRVKNEKLEAEVNFKNIQLADYTMSVIRRNEQLIRIRDEFVKLPIDKSSGFTRAFQEKILRLFDKQLSSDEDWKTFETHFDQAHQDFINRLKTEYPFLTQSDLKLCAYLRLNISSKEIAHLLNISLRGVEVRRYRLRKRLNLNTEDNLYDFLLKF